VPSRKKILFQASPNLALIKYWGKEDHRLNLPMNASISIPLGDLWSRVTVWRSPVDDWAGDLSQVTVDTREKICKFFALVRSQYSELPKLSGSCQTNFIPGCGIASSSSFYAALAAAILETIGIRDLSVVARVARLGSGSATRSVYSNAWAAWLPGSNYDSVGYALDEGHLPTHWYNIALVYDTTHKKLSSREGHKLMDSLSWRDRRIKNANKRFLSLCHAIQSKSWGTLCEVVHEETQEFVAMLQADVMMRHYHNESCREVLKQVHNLFRAKSEDAIWSYTVDAGSTVHVFGDEAEIDKVVSLLKIKPQKSFVSRIYGGLQRIREPKETEKTTSYE
jgi:diphosphomevalonate decarboxylase